MDTLITQHLIPLLGCACFFLFLRKGYVHFRHLGGLLGEPSSRQPYRENGAETKDVTPEDLKAGLLALFYGNAAIWALAVSVLTAWTSAKLKDTEMRLSSSQGAAGRHECPTDGESKKHAREGDPKPAIDADSAKKTCIVRVEMRNGERLKRIGIAYADYPIQRIGREELAAKSADNLSVLAGAYGLVHTMSIEHPGPRILVVSPTIAGLLDDWPAEDRDVRRISLRCGEEETTLKEHGMLVHGRDVFNRDHGRMTSEPSYLGVAYPLHTPPPLGRGGFAFT
jgi:hypothetical protein